MFHVAGGGGRFLPCDLICSSFGYDKPGIWTKGLFTRSPSQRSQNWGCPSRCLLWVLSCTLQSAPLFNTLGLGLLFLFFLIFLVCIFRSAFKQGTEVPNLRNQGKQEVQIFWAMTGHHTEISIVTEEAKEGRGDSGSSFLSPAPG